MIWVEIGIIGGTGPMGRGLAIRWALTHQNFVESRNLDNAERVAKELNAFAKGFYQVAKKGRILGALNTDVVQESEVIVITLPHEATIPIIRELASQTQCTSFFSPRSQKKFTSALSNSDKDTLEIFARRINKVLLTSYYTRRETVGFRRGY